MAADLNIAAGSALSKACPARLLCYHPAPAQEVLWCTA